MLAIYGITKTCCQVPDGPYHSPEDRHPFVEFEGLPTIWRFYWFAIGYGEQISILRRTQLVSVNNFIKERTRGLKYLHNLASCVTATKKKMTWSNDDDAKQYNDVIKRIRATADKTHRCIRDAEDALRGLQEH
jgi:hypothetical protein